MSLTSRLRARRGRARRGDDPRGESGAVLVMVVGMMVMLLAVAALALDLGRYSILRSRLQNTADMAATAGATAYDFTALRRGESRLNAPQAQARTREFFYANNLQGIQVRNLQVNVVQPAGVGPDGVSYRAPTVVVRVQARAGAPLFGRVLGADVFDLNINSAASLTSRYQGGR